MRRAKKVTSNPTSLLQVHEALDTPGTPYLDSSSTDKPATEYSIILLGLDNAGKTTLLNQIKNLFPTASVAQNASSDPAPSESAGNTVPTVGQNVATIVLPDMYLKIWDVGGQMTLRRLWTSYYKASHAVVFVVDGSDLGGLEEELAEQQQAGVAEPGQEGAGLAVKKGKVWHGRRKSSYNFPPVEEDGEDAKMQDGGGNEEPQTPITPSMLHPTTRLDECRAVLESVLSHPDASGVPILVLANKQDREDCLEVVRIKEGFVRPVFEGEKGAMVRDSRVLPVSALKGNGVTEAVEWVRTRVKWNKEGRPPVMR